MKRLLRAEWRGAFVQHPADMSRERHISQQMPQEYALALVERGVGECQAILGELQIAALELGKAQHLQGFRDRKQLVDLHLQIRGNLGQIRLAVERRGRDRLHQAGQQVRGHMRQDAADPQSRKTLLAAAGPPRLADARSSPRKCAPPARESSGRGDCAAAAASP